MIFLTGHKGSGKTTVANMLQTYAGLIIIDTGPLWRELSQAYDLDIKGFFNKMNQLTGVNDWEDRFIFSIIKDIEHSSCQSKIVISGYRNYNDVSKLRSWLEESSITSEVWHIKTPLEKAQTQFTVREGLTEGTSLYAEIYQSEVEQGCDQFEQIASEVIENNGDISHLETKVLSRISARYSERLNLTIERERVTEIIETVKRQI